MCVSPKQALLVIPYRWLGMGIRGQTQEVRGQVKRLEHIFCRLCMLCEARCEDEHCLNPVDNSRSCFSLFLEAGSSLEEDGVEEDR